MRVLSGLRNGALALLALAACSPKTTAGPPKGPLPTVAGMAAAKTLPSPYNGGDPVAGRQAFNLCADCHRFDGSTGKGPSLAGMFGRPAASRLDFTYSEALRTSGVVWDPKHLDQWIFNPHETLAGTSMRFIGVRNDKTRRDLLAYLVAMSEGPLGGTP
jgi:cytochrome c